jgi:hypothetical protein
MWLPRPRWAHWDRSECPGKGGKSGLPGAVRSGHGEAWLPLCLVNVDDLNMPIGEHLDPRYYAPSAVVHAALRLYLCARFSN